MNNAQVVEKMNADGGFDLEELDTVAEATYRCGVRFDDEGDAISGFIIASKNSVECTTAQKKIRVNGIMRSHKRKKDIDATTESGATVVMDSIASNNRTLALGVVVGWFGFNKGGKPATFDKAMVAQMFDKSPTWQDKVLNDLENEANFLPVKSKD